MEELDQKREIFALCIRQDEGEGEKRYYLHMNFYRNVRYIYCFIELLKFLKILGFEH